MYASIVPYRQNAISEKYDLKKSMTTGLIIPKPKHKCNSPRVYFETRKIKLFWLIPIKYKKKMKIPFESLFRCPKCLKTFRYTYNYNDVWVSDTEARENWKERTGEGAEENGEP